MWIESLYDSVWVSMKHITHFKIEEDDSVRRGNHLVYAYLDTSSPRRRMGYEASQRWEQDQARILVCQGSKEECREFVEKQQFYEDLLQWVGYFVAGGIGAIITLIFSSSGGPQ